MKIKAKSQVQCYHKWHAVNIPTFCSRMTLRPDLFSCECHWVLVTEHVENVRLCHWKLSWWKDDLTGNTDQVSIKLWLQLPPVHSTRHHQRHPPNRRLDILGLRAEACGTKSAVVSLWVGRIALMICIVFLSVKVTKKSLQYYLSSTLASVGWVIHFITVLFRGLNGHTYCPLPKLFNHLCVQYFKTFLREIVCVCRGGWGGWRVVNV